MLGADVASTSSYPAPRLSLGRIRDLGASDLLEALYDQILAPPQSIDLGVDLNTLGTHNNFTAAGMEGVTVSLSLNETAANGTVLKTPPMATAKVAHPASTYLVCAHGGHNGSLEISSDGTVAFSPDSASMNNVTSTYLLMSCSALDLHDYNGFWAHPHFRASAVVGYPQETDIGESAFANRTFGGALWSAQVPAARFLLGYANPVIADTRYFRSYQQELANYTPPASGSHNPKVVAWMRANLNIGREGGDLWTALGACAFDRALSRYYFISYEPPPGDYEANGLPRTFERLDDGIWYVSTNPDPGNPSDWTKGPKDIATPMEGQVVK